LLLLATILCFSIYTAQSYPAHVYGADVSQATSKDSFACLVGNNITFTIVRAYESVGRPDPNAPGTVKNAWAGGMAHVDVYMFPCPKCGNAAGQVQSAVTALKNGGATYGMMWFDIEGTQYWMGQAANQQFFQDLISEGKKLGLKIGIYSSQSQWTAIFGSSYSGGASYPLWYAHYDGIPSFADFKAFGGWTYPAIKQFSDAGAKCGAGYDINWYPD